MNSLESLNFELLELLGTGYVIEHYISFFHKIQEEKLYKGYVTESLRLMTENTAKMAHGGSYLKARYVEMLEPKKEETRTSEEVINDIKMKLERL